MNNPAIDTHQDIVPQQVEVDVEAVYQSVYKHFKDQVEAFAPKKLDKVSANVDFNLIGMNSLEVLSVVMDLEEELGLWVPDKEIEKFTNIESVVDYLVTVLSQPAAQRNSEQPEE